MVDRKDLDYQTMREYQRFPPDSVNGSDSTAGLKRNLERDDKKIIVTTIQKLNNLIKGEGNRSIYGKQVVFIFDECHRSQFGEAQKNLKRKFKRFYESLTQLQKDSEKPLKVATIFSFAANEEQDAIGDIRDESSDVSAMHSSAKEFLNTAIADYNAHFKTSFSVDSQGFQND